MFSKRSSNMKYVLILGLMIGVIAISPLSASDDFSMLDALGITPFSEDTIVTVDGINFNIPEGYGENVDVSKDGEVDEVNNVNFITFSREYMNNDADTIFIHIFYDEQQIMDSDMLSTTTDGENKTINDVNGIFSKDDELYSFNYIKDGKSISISASDESSLSKIIINQ